MVADGNRSGLGLFVAGFNHCTRKKLMDALGAEVADSAVNSEPEMVVTPDRLEVFVSDFIANTPHNHLLCMTATLDCWGISWIASQPGNRKVTIMTNDVSLPENYQKFSTSRIRGFVGHQGTSIRFWDTEGEDKTLKQIWCLKGENGYAAIHSGTEFTFEGMKSDVRPRVVETANIPLLLEGVNGVLSDSRDYTESLQLAFNQGKQSQSLPTQ